MHGVGTMCALRMLGQAQRVSQAAGADPRARMNSFKQLSFAEKIHPTFW